jgi:hypothetical protein
MFAIYGHTCHLCGHGGATDADHLTPISKWSTQPIDPHLMRPAHGIRGCPHCPLVAGKTRKCNQSKGARIQQPFHPALTW